MNVGGLQKVIAKLMILNSNRMAEIRDSFNNTDEEKAEYDARFNEQEWYNKIMDETQLQLLEREMNLAKEVLSHKIKTNLEANYDEILDKIRRPGAGLLANGLHRHVNRPKSPYQKQMTQEDRDFLEGCGIKVKRGETW